MKMKKEPMPCKYMLPILAIVIIGIIDGSNLGLLLLVVAALISVIVGEGQFWVKEPEKKECLYPEQTYRDYRILCERNGRTPVSGEEWNEYIRLDAKYW